MMMDLSPEDVRDLKQRGGIDPFPELDVKTQKDPHAQEDDRPRVLQQLSRIFVDHDVDVSDVSSTACCVTTLPHHANA